jgi:hypothetical protein
MPSQTRRLRLWLRFLLVDPIQFRVGLLELAARLLSHLGLRLSVRWVSTAEQ